MDFAGIEVTAYAGEVPFQDGNSYQNGLIPVRELTFSPTVAEMRREWPEASEEPEVITMMWTYSAMGVYWPDEVVVSNVRGAEYSFPYDPQEHQTRSPVHCNRETTDAYGNPIYYTNIDHHGYDQAPLWGPVSSSGDGDIAKRFFSREVLGCDIIQVTITWNNRYTTPLTTTLDVTVQRLGGITQGAATPEYLGTTEELHTPENEASGKWPPDGYYFNPTGGNDQSQAGAWWGFSAGAAKQYLAENGVGGTSPL